MPAETANTLAARIAILIRDRNYVHLWVAMFLSSVGSGLLLMSLSLVVLDRSGSVLTASLVFVMPWIGALLLMPVLSRLTRLFSPIGLLILAAAAAAMATGFAFEFALPLAFLFLLPRAMADSTGRVSRFRALKRLIAPAKLEVGSSLFNTCTYLGAGSGLLLAPLLTSLPMPLIAGIDAGTFLLSAAIYANVRRHHAARAKPQRREDAPAPERTSWNAITAAIREHRLIPLLVVAGLATGTSQTFLTVGREVIPLRVFDLGAPGVQLFLAAALCGLVCGPLFVSRYLQAGAWLPQRPSMWLTAAAAAGVLSATIGTALAALAMFAVLAFLFETTYTLIQNRLVVRVPEDQVAHVILTRNVVQLTALACAVPAFGAAVDRWGFLASGLVLMGTTLAVGAILDGSLMLSSVRRERES